jgi:hypothetical protein
VLNYVDKLLASALEGDFFSDPNLDVAQTLTTALDSFLPGNPPQSLDYVTSIMNDRLGIGDGDGTEDG